MHNDSFSKLLQNFFVERLINQQHVSPETKESYKYTFCLLLNFFYSETHKEPSALEDLNEQTILKFLNYLEKDRKNSISTRNLRLAAIRAFFNYAYYQAPESAETIQRVLAIPKKRSNRPVVSFLSEEEINVIINTPNISRWSGVRDHTMFMTLYNTGARVSEITGLRIADVALNTKVHIKIHGKGRKERVLPLWKRTSRLIKNWLNYLDGNGSDLNGFLFPNRQGKQMTRHGAKERLRLAKDIAVNKCPSLKDKKISPHTIRRTCAVHMLEAGENIVTISLWLGHKNISTTYQYLEASLSMKEKTLQKYGPPSTKNIRFCPTKPQLNFLKSL